MQPLLRHGRGSWGWQLGQGAGFGARSGEGSVLVHAVLAGSSAQLHARQVGCRVSLLS